MNNINNVLTTLNTLPTTKYVKVKDLDEYVYFRIDELEAKNSKYGWTVVAKLDDGRMVNLPKRYSDIIVKTPGCLEELKTCPTLYIIFEDKTELTTNLSFYKSLKEVRARLNEIQKEKRKTGMRPNILSNRIVSGGRVEKKKKPNQVLSSNGLKAVVKNIKKNDVISSSTSNIGSNITKSLLCTENLIIDEDYDEDAILEEEQNQNLIEEEDESALSQNEDINVE